METIYNLVVSWFAGKPEWIPLAIAIAVPILFVVAVFPGNIRLHNTRRTQGTRTCAKPVWPEPCRTVGNSAADRRWIETVDQGRHRAAQR